MGDSIRVLYVDDEPDLLTITRLFLEKDGAFVVSTVTSVQEALEHLTREHYDVIISDYQMPEIDGIMFLKQLKATGNTTPFIIFTGKGREEVVIEALNNGADFYIQKGGDPVAQFAELSNKIRYAVTRRNAEQALSESRQRMTDIINHQPDATFAIDLDGKVIAWNRAMEEMTGVRKEEILGTGDHSYAIPFYGTRRPVLLDLVLKENKEIWEKYPHIARKGTKLISEIYIPLLYGGKGAWLWFTASPLYDTNGKITGAIESIRDITDLKRAEADLRDSETRYRNVVEDQTEFICRFLPDGTHIFVNEAYCRYFGLKRQEIIDTQFRPTIHPDDRRHVALGIASLTTGNPLVSMEQRIIMPDGTIRWQHWVDRAIFDEVGRLKEYQSVGRDITGNKQVEEALESAKDKYTKAFMASPDAIVISDLETGRFVEMNDKTFGIYGYSRDEMKGKSGLELGTWLRTEDRDTFIDCLKANGRVEKYEVVERRKSGELFNASVSADIIVINNRQHLISVVRDITERKKVEEALRKDEAQLKQIIDLVPHMIFAKDWNGTYLLANKAVADGYNTTVADLVGNTQFKFHTDRDELRRMLEDDREVITTGKTKFIPEELYLDASGKHRVLQTIKVPFTIFGNNQQAVLGVAIDITEQKQAEEALKKSEDRYRSLVETTGTGYVILDKTGRVVTANREYVRLTGRTGLAGIEGRPVTEWTAPYDLIRNAKEIRQCLRTGQVRGLEIDYQRPDGTIQPIEINASVVQSDSGPIILTLCRDITERRHVEEEYRTIFNSVSAIIWYLDTDGSIIRANQTAAEAVSLTIDQILGKTVYDLFPKEEADLFCADNREVIRSGRPKFGIIEHYTLGNGRTRWAQTDKIPYYDKDGKILGVIIFVNDITDRQRTEEFLTMANKKLTLLSSISRHDIDNQLTVLMGNLSFLSEEHLDPVQRECLSKAETAAQRISTMVRFTKEYEQIGSNIPVWHNVRSLVENAAKEAPLGKINMENNLPPRDEIFADPLISRVFYNLMDNATRYGGKITTIRFSAEERGDNLLIACEDDGNGIPADEKEKIFERGFGKNTGLGLFLAREILDITGITIRETGEPEKGARFEITVPKMMWRRKGEY